MSENTNEKPRNRDGSIVRTRMICITTAFIAMCMSFFTLVYVFGSDVIDMGNMCYYIYVSAPGHDDESFLKAVTPMMRRVGLSGWTIRKNVRGAYMNDNGDYVFEDSSYQIIMAAAPKRPVEDLARMMLDEFKQETVLIEEVIADAKFIENATHFRKLHRDDAVRFSGFSSIWHGFVNQFSPNF